MLTPLPSLETIARSFGRYLATTTGSTAMVSATAEPIHASHWARFRHQPTDAVIQFGVDDHTMARMLAAEGYNGPLSQDAPRARISRLVTKLQGSRAKTVDYDTAHWLAWSGWNTFIYETEVGEVIDLTSIWEFQTASEPLPVTVSERFQVLYNDTATRDLIEIAIV